MTDLKNPEIETIIKTIGAAKQIAIVLPVQANIDAVGAAIALYTTLAIAVKKPATIFGIEPAELAFLKNPPKIYDALNSSNQLAIKVSNKTAQPGELRYEKTDDGLTVFITPKDNGQFKETDVTILPGAANFDLLIILGATNFEAIGKLYTDNTKLFFETPHINIDTNPSNEYFGTINLVNTTASSISEVVMDIIEMTPEVLNTEIVSTALLSGIISQTSSFRDPKTTPQAMFKASRLISAGAKQQEIIQHLFKTKPLPLLQLWGRALARLVSLPEKQILTAVVTKSDLEKTHVGVESLPIVVGDIIEMITGYSLVVLLAELPTGGVQLILAGMPFEDLSKLSSSFASETISKPLALVGKYEYVSLHINRDLEQVQQQLNKLIDTRNSVV